MSHFKLSMQPWNISPGNLSLNYKIAKDYKKLGEDEKYEQTMNEVIFR